MPRSTRSSREQPGSRLAGYVADGDTGCGLPGDLLWHRIWIMQLEGTELFEYVMEIGVEKTIEALDVDST